MKINYQNENYMPVMIPIIITSILIPLIILWGYFHESYKNKYGILFVGTSVILLVIFLIIFIISYKKRKKRRELNLSIIDNGIVIPGKIESIYRKRYLGDEDSPGKTIVYATISFYIDNEKKEVNVKNINIPFFVKLKDYQDKEVKIYVYNKMMYIDIIN